MTRDRGRKAPIAMLAALGIVLAAAAGGRYWYLRARDGQTTGPDGSTGAPLELESTRAEVTVFCGNCHAVPSPAAFPQVAWREEVRKGFEFYAESERNDLAVPPVDRVVKFFRVQAPEEITVPPAKDDPRAPSVRFRATSSRIGNAAVDRSAISYLRWDSLAAGAPSTLLLCDMRTGELFESQPRRDAISLRVLANAGHPAHAVPCDLDGDGQLDLVVADLGSFLPADHAEGRVLWLRRGTGDAVESIVLQEGLGRVADVEPGDFDGDGDLDLVVAEFGWHKTGRILLLENQSTSGESPRFDLRVIDSRHGTIHVPTVDLDGNGRLDFVALISQEHETIEAFLNVGDGQFHRETLFVAGEPAFGSSGIQLTDLNGDGRMDILYTAGDTFDSMYLKPYHGIRWLENQSDGTFAAHEIAPMPGVNRSLAADLDGDGDLDIAACALLPEKVFGRQPGQDFDAVMWLEQTAPGKFARHSLLRAACFHAAMEIADFDEDGRLDIAVGGFAGPTAIPQLTVWWNEGN